MNFLLKKKRNIFLLVVVVFSTFVTICFVKVPISYNKFTGGNLFVFSSELEALRFMDNNVEFSLGIDSLRVTLSGQDNRVTNNPNEVLAGIDIKGSKYIKLYKIVSIKEQLHIQMKQEDFIVRIINEIEGIIHTKELPKIILTEDTTEVFD